MRLEGLGQLKKPVTSSGIGHSGLWDSASTNYAIACLIGHTVESNFKNLFKWDADF
jgi:hypothetical protein